VCPLSYFSRKLSPAEQRYCTFDRELLAVYCDIRHFRHFLEGREFCVLNHWPTALTINQTAYHKYANWISSLSSLQIFAISQSCGWHSVTCWRRGNATECYHTTNYWFCCNGQGPPKWQWTTNFEVFRHQHQTCKSPQPYLYLYSVVWYLYRNSPSICPGIIQNSSVQFISWFVTSRY